jgi:hypothetical protein
MSWFYRFFTKSDNEQVVTLNSPYIQLTGSATLTGALAQTGAQTVTGNLTVTGDVGVLEHTMLRTIKQFLEPLRQVQARCILVPVHSVSSSVRLHRGTQV